MKDTLIPAIGYSLVFFIIMGYIWSMPEETTTKKVPCYDRNQNKIMGLTCSTTEEGIKFEDKLILTSLVFSLCLVFAFLFILQNRWGMM